MPSLSRITATFFTSLITRLGVRPPPEEAFQLSNVVQPVSIVDTDITLPATSTSVLLDTPFTAGESAVPVGGTRLADTGALAAGNYYCLLLVDINEVADIRIRRRNAADTADIWGHRLRLGVVGGSSGHGYMLNFYARLSLNERLAVENVANGGGGSIYQASLWVQGPV